MPAQQGQGHYPSNLPGNASAGPSGTQTPTQNLAREPRSELGNQGTHDPQQKARIQPDG